MRNPLVLGSSIQWPPHDSVNRRFAMKRRNFWCGFVLLAMSVAASPAWGWQPAEGPLKTRWTKDVSPEKAWPEYPRPQMVRKDWTNLNGLWQYAIRPRGDEAAGEMGRRNPGAVSGRVGAVGREEDRSSPTSGFGIGALHRWQAEGRRARLLLHFGAVDWQCTVWVNDKQVGQHTGGYDPFTFDITDALRDERQRAGRCGLRIRPTPARSRAASRC